MPRTPAAIAPKTPPAPGGAKKRLGRRAAGRRAADAHLFSVNENVRAGRLRIAEHAIGRVRIIEAERQVIEALRVEAFDFVKALRHLPIAFAPLRAGAAGRRKYRP